MDKKRFDHIEEDMRAASEGWQPPFDEKAWEHMEHLLEGENDRKRPVAWWMWLLPLLFVAGIATYFILKNDKPGKPTTTVAQNITGENKENVSPDNTNSSTTSPQDKDNTGTGIINDDSNKNAIQPGNNNGRMKVNIVAPKTFSTAINDDPLNDLKKISDSKNGKMKMTVNAGMTGTDEKKENNNDPQEDETKTNIVTTAVVASPTEQPVSKTEKPEPVVNTNKEKQTDTISSKEKTQKEKRSKPSKFYFSVFGGMEGNGVNFPGLNKVSPRAGFTVGYYFSRNLSIQTGFFTGSKKYVAGKYDYKPKAGSYWSTVDITKVDANCRVFEIPLALRYDFTPSKKWNAFAAAGLSSYIMDKEDYAYDYIRYNTPYHAKASYKGNQHSFSVLRISGGVETKLSKQFSLGINPGLAIPLAGVGEGQIKLFSSELLLSLKYRPFKKSK